MHRKERVERLKDDEDAVHDHLDELQAQRRAECKFDMRQQMTLYSLHLPTQCVTPSCLRLIHTIRKLLMFDVLIGEAFAADPSRPAPQETGIDYAHGILEAT